MSTIRLLDKPAHQQAKERRAEAVAIVMTQPIKWRLDPKFPGRVKSIENLVSVHRSSLPGREKDERFSRILSYIFHSRPLAVP